MQKKERNEELEYIDDFENIEEPEESGRKEENPIQRMQLLWQGNF